MGFYLYFAAILFGLLTLLKAGEALRCWSCISDDGRPCSDFFNTSSYVGMSASYNGLQNAPYLANCNHNTQSVYGQGPSNYQNTQDRPVCMKKKQTNKRFGTTTYIRQCHYLRYGDQIGRCPDEVTNSDLTIDFCEYCDNNDGCNGATALQNGAIWAALIPTALALILRK